MSMKIKDLNDMFITTLVEIYDGEMQLIEALPSLAEAAKDPELQTVISEHWSETKLHAEKLKEIAKNLKISLTKRKNKIMSALLSVGDNTINSVKEDRDLIDTAIENAAEKVEHYEIATYEDLIILAKRLKLDNDIIGKLKENFDEEKKAAEKIKNLANEDNSLLASLLTS
jgi:ferritin-like metal-binding protein YciE